MARKFVQLAQTAEEYGYDTFAVPDHLGNQVGPLAALGRFVAGHRPGSGWAPRCWPTGGVTPRCWPGEANTIDVLSKGRLEAGHPVRAG